MRKTQNRLKPVDAPDFTYWQALTMAFYSSRLYIDVVKRWKGFGLTYLLLLCLIGALPLSVRIIQQFFTYFNDQIIVPLEQLPPILIQNGQASFSGQMPFYIKNNKGENVLAVDTRENIKGFSEQSPKVSMLVTRDKMFFRLLEIPQFPGLTATIAEGKPYVYQFDKHDNEVFVGKEWIQSSGVLYVKYYAAVLVYPMMVGALFGLYFIINLVMSSLGRVITLVFIKHNIPFRTSLRLGWVVSTVPFTMMIIVHTLGLIMGGLGLFYVVLFACYYTYAMLAVKRESQGMVLG